MSKLTKEHVTVALSGDGGDELFGGYTRYFIADRYGSALVRGPAQVRRAAACVLAGVPPHLWNVLARLIPESRRSAQFGEQIQKLGRALRGGGENGFYQALISHWDMPEHLVAGAREYRTVAWDDALAARMPDFVSRMQYLDTATYLPDDILTKVDRASMAVSLEARVPLLDHRVVEFAWSLPRAMKVRNGQGKWILRQLLSRYLPEDIIKRRKVGFSVPIGEWLRGPLKEWAGDLLSPESISRHGILRPEPVSAAWKEHLSGGRVRPLPLWTVLMFQAWCEEYLV